MAAELWRFPDRETESGKRINKYLSKELEMTDEEVHLLFVQNRWEKRCAMLVHVYAECNVYAECRICFCVLKQHYCWELLGA